MADFRREYHLTADQLAAMDAREFGWLLQGLSKHSVFLTAWRKQPKHVYDRSEIEAVHAAARR